MEIGNQVKKYRNEMNLSQDELAQKIYVSLDMLVKGDLEKMKEEIKEEDITSFKKLSNIFAVFLLAMILLPLPLKMFMGNFGVQFGY